MGKVTVTWIVNKYGDIEVYKGDLDKKEMDSRSYDLYLMDDDADYFLLINGIWHPEVGDWDAGKVYLEELNKY